MTVTSIDANPAEFQVLTSETIPFTLEWVDLIGNGKTISTPSAKMYDNANGIEIPNGFVNNYGSNGSQGQYIIDGTKLQAEHIYTGILSANVGSQVYRQRILVTVPR